MEYSSLPPASKPIKVFRYGKGFVFFLASFGVLLMVLAGLLFSLKSRVPPEGQSTVLMAMGILLLIALSLYALAGWQRMLRVACYEVHASGIVQIKGSQRNYVAFAEMEDLYLFSSGKMGPAGLVNNLAYRRNGTEAFYWANGHLKHFFEFQQLVRQLHVEARLPAVTAALASGEAVTFNYIPAAQVWKKRLLGGFLKVSTQPITLSCDVLECNGQRVPISSLRQAEVSQWSEKVVVRDASGAIVLSTMSLGILSMDLFLATLESLLEARCAQ